MRWSAWWWLALGGCTYVTEAEYDAQLLQRDEDRDGVTVGEGDCDDTDPLVFPGQTEKPYDGIDNDCLGNGDLADVDGDGSVAIEAGGDDCDDEDAEVAPGRDDPPYDGIDSDCARDNDFDHDGDGYMALVATRELVDAYRQSTGARFEPRYGDCDDQDPSTFPGSPAEVPYDGVDSDCDGADDFDADGDGHAAIEAGGDDCLDQARAELPVAPDEVYPGAPDAPYDGIDSDCGSDNDFDVDEDGFVREGDFAAYQLFESVYGYGLDARAGDCDDARSFVNPDGLERLGDTLDQNCDGDPDQATWASGGITVAQPGAPHLTVVDGSFVLVVGGAAVAAPSVPSVDNGVLMAVLDRNLGPAGSLLDADVPLGPLAEPPGPALSLAPRPGGVGLAQVARDGVNFVSTVITRDITSGALDAPLVRQSASLDSEAPVAASLRAVDGELRLVACVGSQLAFVVDETTVTAPLDGPATTCFQDADGLAWGCTAAGCRSFEASAAPLALVDPVDDPDPLVWSRQRVTLRSEVITGVTGVRLVNPGQPDVRVLPAETVRQADAVSSGGEWFVVAVTDPEFGPNQLRLLWGPSTGPFQSTGLADFDPARPDLEPIGAAIAANEGRLVVVVTLSDGVEQALGWAVYERT